MSSTTQHIIVEKMEKIKHLFQEAQERALQSDNLLELNAYLQKTDKEFLPVVYEGAAMAMALQDFSDGTSISKWKNFLDSSPRYACQIYIGMGWAVGKEQKNNLPFLGELRRNMQFRLWDGCGYYDGIFRQRNTLKGQKRAENILPENFQAYDEGVGRAIWYASKGDHLKVKELILQFSADRHADLWRGIGIACCFVGGFDEGLLKDLLDAAGNHSVQLSIGAAMVAKSRIEADCMTEETELANRILNNMSAKDAMAITVRNKTVSDFTFSKFIKQMETELSKSKILTNTDL